MRGRASLEYSNQLTVRLRHRVVVERLIKDFVGHARFTRNIAERAT
jgi:hypothetical protein